MRADGDRVTNIDNKQNKVGFPSTARYIGQCAISYHHKTW